MPGLSKIAALERLRRQIDGIEKRPPLAEGVAVAGTGPSRQWRAAPPGILHEVFSDERRNAGGALGFALGQARGLLTPERPALVYLQLDREAQEMGLPYGAGLASFGLDPHAVAIIRAATAMELLWAAEEALTCRAVAAIVVDVGGDPGLLDFTASRRLGLRAAAMQTSLLLLRYGRGRTASAARLRWHLRPASSGALAFDPRAPGQSRWQVRLEKGILQGKANGEWLLDWTENGFDIRDLDICHTDGPVAAAPVPRPVPAPLGDRLSQTA